MENWKAVYGIMLTLVLTGMLTSVFKILPAKASGTIYIRADGSVDPPAAPIQRYGNVYTFTDNIHDEIEVQRSDIIIDGNGYTLRGSGSGIGFNLTSINNVTIRNTNIKNFFWGVYLDSSFFNTISGNNITNNDVDGISLYESSNNSICGNNVTNNDDGIWLIFSSNNTIYANGITANRYDGLWLVSSLNNTISENNIAANNEVGIWFYESSNNTIYHNNLANNADQVYTFKSVNVWDNGCEGNYWSDYTGTDADGDGIGDTPYTIDEDNQDNYPLMKPYMVGDINHDGTVDMYDLATVGKTYGSQPGDSNWNCHCDITGAVENPEKSGLYPPDGVVDVYDLATVGKAMGKATMTNN